MQMEGRVVSENGPKNELGWVKKQEVLKNIEHYLLLTSGLVHEICA